MKIRLWYHINQKFKSACVCTWRYLRRKHDTKQQNQLINRIITYLSVVNQLTSQQTFLLHQTTLIFSLWRRPWYLFPYLCLSVCLSVCLFDCLSLPSLFYRYPYPPSILFFLNDKVSEPRCVNFCPFLCIALDIVK